MLAPVFLPGGAPVLTGPPSIPTVPGYRLDTDQNGNTFFVFPESLGQKLRKLSEQALNNNVWSRPPMKANPAWQPSTAYKQYAVVVNGGNLYVCTTSGTSASTGGPTQTNNTAVTDGSAIWTYYGVNVVTVDPSVEFTPGLKSWATSTVYAAGQLVQTSFGNMYACVIGGTSGSSQPTGTTNAVTDNTVTWTYMGVYRTTTCGNDFPTYTYQTSGPGGLTNVYNPQNAMATQFAAVSAQVLAGGSGYAVNDTITLTGGSYQYTFVVSGITTAPTVNATYTNNSLTYTVLYSAITAGSGTVVATATGNALASGTLTKTGGTGDSTIAFSSVNTAVPTILKVTAVSSGAVATVSVTTAGSYAILPTSPVSQGSTSGSGTSATFIVRWPDPTWCKLRGCYNGGGYFTNGIRAYTFQATPNATPIEQHCSFEFMTDAPKLYLYQGSGGGQWSVIVDTVDGKPTRVALNPTDYPSSASNYYIYDFSATSGRRIRRWKFETTYGSNISQIGVDTSSQIWAPDDQDRVRAVVISDSIWSGSSYGPYLTGGTVSQRVGHMLGWADVWSYTQGGTGYCNPGTSPGVTTNVYGDRVAECVSINPDIVLWMGSTTDLSYTATQVTAAALAAFHALRTAGFAGPIIVFGLWSLNDTGDSAGHNVIAMEQAVQAAVTSFADSLTWFVPIRQAIPLPWITGSWNNSANTNSTNASQYINANDNEHPIDLGTAYLAGQVANSIRSQVLPNIP